MIAFHCSQWKLITCRIQCEISSVKKFHNQTITTYIPIENKNYEQSFSLNNLNLSDSLLDYPRHRVSKLKREKDHILIDNQSLVVCGFLKYWENRIKLWECGMEIEIRGKRIPNDGWKESGMVNEHVWIEGM